MGSYNVAMILSVYRESEFSSYIYFSLEYLSDVSMPGRTGLRPTRCQIKLLIKGDTKLDTLKNTIC